jgi:hypothetical protein
MKTIIIYIIFTFSVAAGCVAQENCDPILIGSLVKELNTLNFAAQLGTCQNPCSIEGEWLVTGTKNRLANSYTHDRASFKNDTMVLASGFYYPIVDQNNAEPDDLATGKYPFVYYGNREPLKMEGDSLYVYSTPYKVWDSYKIICTSKGIKLVQKNDELILTKSSERKVKRNYEITYVKAHIYESHPYYGIDFRVTYSKGDLLTFQQLSEKDSDHTVKTFQLKRGSFAEMCEGLYKVDVLQLKNRYPAQISDPEIIELEIGLSGGRVVNSIIEIPDYPKELEIALIPVLYGHQRFVYGQLKPFE